jgi:hypothetical protein
MHRNEQVLITIKIVLVLAANKSDLYQYEDVPELTGKNFAKEINALFIQTSAKSAAGIDVYMQI